MEGFYGQVNDVKISLQSNPTKFSDGKIFKILSDVDLIRVLLTNGIQVQLYM